MDFQIKNKTAIVCASSQGLGKAAALELASEGVNLVISSRNEENLLTVKKEICLLYTSPSPRDGLLSRMPAAA